MPPCLFILYLALMECPFVVSACCCRRKKKRNKGSRLQSQSWANLFCFSQMNLLDWCLLLGLWARIVQATSVVPHQKMILSPVSHLHRSTSIFLYQVLRWSRLVSAVASWTLRAWGTSLVGNLSMRCTFRSGENVKGGEGFSCNSVTLRRWPRGRALSEARL